MPSTVYVGADGTGVFRSLDGGVTWRPASEGLDDLNVSSLAIDPVQPSTLYAGTGRGVFKTIDGGAVWKISCQLGGVYEIVIDPSSPSSVFAAASTGVLVSGDRGTTWAVVPLGDPVVSVALDPARPFVLYAATGLPFQVGSIFKSMDGGAHWVLTAPLLPGEPPGSATPANVLAVDQSGRVYAGSDRGLFASADGGSSWSPVLPLDPRVRVVSIALAPSSSSTIYAGVRGLHLPGALYPDGTVLRSTDGGQTFLAGDSGLPSSDPVAVAVDPRTPDTVFAGFTDTSRTQGAVNPGVFRTVDGGASWSSLGGSFAAVYVQSLGASPHPGGFLYAGSPDGVFRTRDSGVTWELVGRELAGRGVYGIEIDAFDTHRVYASTGRGLFLSADAGDTWAIVSDLPSDRDVRAKISAAVPGAVYAGASLYSSPPQLFRSSDGGVSWAALPEPPGNLNLTDPNDASVIYVSSYEGIFRSTDGGNSWSEFYALGNPFGGGGVEGIEKGNSSRIYASVFGCSPGGFCTGGLSATRDGGASWKTVFSGAPVTDFKIHPTSQALSCLSSSGQNVFYGLGVTCSFDVGETWSNFRAGLPSIGASAVAFDPTSMARVYAGTSQGVFALDFPRVLRTDPRQSLPRLIPPR